MVQDFIQKIEKIPRGLEINGLQQNLTQKYKHKNNRGKLASIIKMTVWAQ
jgi:hypothetical protein